MYTECPGQIGICLVCILAVLVCGPTASARSAEQTPSGVRALPDEVRGLWVWKEAAIVTDQEQDRLLDFCEAYGFNLLLMQVHQVNDAPTPTLRHPGPLKRLIREAVKRGIVVEALDGAKDMAKAENQAQTLAILDAIIDFNQSLPEGKRFTAIHYDIEPYLMPEWKQGNEKRQVIMRDLLDYYTKARKKLDERGSGMLLACDIPMWYDLKTGPDDHCIIEYNGQTKNLHQHIQDICDYIGIMSYRTRVIGPNSVTEHIENELAYAELIGKRVCAALEVSELDNTPQISFYGWEPDAFLERYNLLRGTLAERPGYGGVLIQSCRALRYMLVNEPITD